MRAAAYFPYTPWCFSGLRSIKDSHSIKEVLRTRSLDDLLGPTGKNDFGYFSLSSRLKRELGVKTFGELLEIKAPRIATLLRTQDDIEALDLAIHWTRLTLNNDALEVFDNESDRLRDIYECAETYAFLYTLRHKNVSLGDLLEENKARLRS